MSDGTVDAKAVTAALIAEGLDVAPDEAHFLWGLSFEVGTYKQSAMLVLPSNTEYFLAIAPIQSSELEGRTLDNLPIETLRAIIKLQSETLLAKFNVIREGSKTLYVAISPCSVVTWDGAKLQKRLHACAELAVQICLGLQGSA